MDRNDKIRDFESINDIICAEIPDLALDSDLYDVIISNMMHGPCGPTHVDSLCMKDGKCSKRYLWEFCNETMQMKMAVRSIDDRKSLEKNDEESGSKANG